MERLIAAMCLLAPLALLGQHQHLTAAPGQQAGMSHHAFLDAERAAIENGEGFGMALAADRNGFPGPKHILDLKAELQLTASQQSTIEKLMAGMKQKALAKGGEVLAAEKWLEEMFRQGRPEPDLRAETGRIAALRGELRWVHLSTHLAAQKILTPEQNVKYQHLRYGAAPQPGQSH